MVGTSAGYACSLDAGRQLQRFLFPCMSIRWKALPRMVRLLASSSSSTSSVFIVLSLLGSFIANAHARRPRSSVDCYCQTLAVPPRSPCPGGAVALQLWAIGCMWWAHQPVRKLYRMLIGSYSVSVSCCHPGVCRWRHLDLPALAELLLCSCGPYILYRVYVVGTSAGHACALDAGRQLQRFLFLCMSIQ